jgi:membrane magnesium transporter 1
LASTFLTEPSNESSFTHQPSSTPQQSCIMGFLSTLVNTAGVIFLTHAYVHSPPPNPILTNPSSVYSSYEHSLSHSTPASTPSTTSPTAPISTANTLPTDIILEILFSTTLLCVGIVLSSPGLRPIQWRTWACEAEKDERREEGKRAFEGEQGGVVGNPFRWVEDGERRGFWDVRVSLCLLYRS